MRKDAGKRRKEISGSERKRLEGTTQQGRDGKRSEQKSQRVQFFVNPK